ncbi:hypothetical protein KEM48_002926 [Puccinia striiformis f. sp. tritici PST-130]|nr:hypothetical protein KEM48_002926 [Puccinia striiformis f. sp. tritici PST-130]
MAYQHRRPYHDDHDRDPVLEISLVTQRSATLNLATAPFSHQTVGSSSPASTTTHSLRLPSTVPTHSSRPSAALPSIPQPTNGSPIQVSTPQRSATDRQPTQPVTSTYTLQPYHRLPTRHYHSDQPPQVSSITVIITRNHHLARLPLTTPSAPLPPASRLRILSPQIITACLIIPADHSSSSGRRRQVGLFEDPDEHAQFPIYDGRTVNISTPTSNQRIVYPHVTPEELTPGITICLNFSRRSTPILRPRTCAPDLERTAQPIGKQAFDPSKGWYGYHEATTSSRPISMLDWLRGILSNNEILPSSFKTTLKHHITSQLPHPQAIVGSGITMILNHPLQPMILISAPELVRSTIHSFSSRSVPSRSDYHMRTTGREKPRPQVASRSKAPLTWINVLDDPWFPELSDHDLDTYSLPQSTPTDPHSQIAASVRQPHCAQFDEIMASKEHSSSLSFAGQSPILSKPSGAANDHLTSIQEEYADQDLDLIPSHRARPSAPAILAIRMMAVSTIIEGIRNGETVLELDWSTTPMDR